MSGEEDERNKPHMHKYKHPTVVCCANIVEIPVLDQALHKILKFLHSAMHQDHVEGLGFRV